MEKIKNLFSGKFFKIFKWIFLILFAGYVILVAVRVVHFFNEDKTNAQVEKIHMTKLQLSDVLGDNLPPDPGPEADKTVEGIDANENGIRDDVELAIFEEYPDSAKTRAVLLQYALALQMEVNQPFVNTTIATEVVREEDRAFQCIGEIFSREDMTKFIENSDELVFFVENRQFNTPERKESRENFYKDVRSYGSLDRVCDIDYLKLSN